MRILGRKFYAYKSKNRRKNSPDSAFPRTLHKTLFHEGFQKGYWSQVLTIVPNLWTVSSEGSADDTRNWNVLLAYLHLIGIFSDVSVGYWGLPKSNVYWNLPESNIKYRNPTILSSLP